jgi:hypothetical protein
MKPMLNVIQADENGELVVPAGVAGQVRPGSRFTVEPCGDAVILRRQTSAAEDWWNSTTPTQRVAWLEDWIASLPQSPALPRAATHRESMYD